MLGGRRHRCRRPDPSFPRSGTSPRPPRRWCAPRVVFLFRRHRVPGRTTAPQSLISSDFCTLFSQTASSHLREGLLALCLSGREENTLNEVLEACDTTHARLGERFADATDEDKRLLVLLCTAAKALVVSLEKQAFAQKRESFISDSRLRDVLKRAWLPVLSEHVLDDGTQRQVIDEITEAFMSGPTRWEIVEAALLGLLQRLGLVYKNEKQNDHEDVFASTRFETAVELTTAFMGIATEWCRPFITRRPEDTFSLVKDNTIQLCVASLSAVARVNARGLTPARRRLLLACVVPAAANAAHVYYLGGGAAICGKTHADALAPFAEETFARAVTMLETPCCDGCESQQFFFDTLGLNATRALVLGAPGAKLGCMQSEPSEDTGGNTNNTLLRALAFGVALEDRRDRRSALGAIKHALGRAGGENAEAWIFDQSPWCEFAALVDALEDFAAHLVEAAWKHVDVLHPPVSCIAKESCDWRPAVPYALVVAAWTRGLRHANPAVRAKTLRTFCDRNWGGGDGSGIGSGSETTCPAAKHVPNSFVTDVLLPCAMDTPGGGAHENENALAPFLAAFVRSRASRAERREVAEVVIAAVATHAPNTNTKGLDVGSSVLNHVARAFETADNDDNETADTDSRPSDRKNGRRQRTETLDEIRRTLDLLRLCATVLLEPSRTSDPLALSSRACAVLYAARVLAPAKSCAAATAATEGLAFARRQNLCFISTLRLLQALPSELEETTRVGVSHGLVHENGNPNHSTRHATASWLRGGGDWFDEGLSRAIKTWMWGTMHERKLDAAAKNDGLQEFTYDATNETALLRETEDETDAIVKNANALALAWSFVESQELAGEITKRVAELAMWTDRENTEVARRRKIKDPSRRRALLLLRASFRLAGALAETPENHHRAERNGCVAFLAAKRDTYHEHVHDGLHWINEDARELCSGTIFNFMRHPCVLSERFALAATGATEAIFRWLCRSSDAFTDEEWFESMMRALCVSGMYCEAMGNGYDDGLSPPRRAGLALAAAAHARGFVALWSYPSPARFERLTKLAGLDLNLPSMTSGNVIKMLCHIDGAVETLLTQDLFESKSESDKAFSLKYRTVEQIAEYDAEVVQAVAAAWTATSAALGIFSPSHESIGTLDPDAAPLEKHELAVPHRLLRRAIGFIPRAADSGADVFRETWRVIGKLLTVCDSFPKLEKHLPKLAADLLSATLQPLFKSSKFRKNAVVWQAVASAVLHPALFQEKHSDSVHVDTGACVQFVKLSVGLAKKSGGQRVARVVSHALAARLIDRPELALGYAHSIFDLGLAGEGGQTRAERLAIAEHWAERELELEHANDKNETAEQSNDAMRAAIAAGRDSAAFARWLDAGGCGGSARGHVASRVAVLTLAHALAVGEPPKGWSPCLDGTDTTRETSESGFRDSYRQSSRSAARAILHVALLAVSGGDPDLTRESYRRGSATHRRKVRAWQMLCASSPALESLGDSESPKSVAENGQLAVVLVAAAPVAISRRELPGVRYYSEAFMCLANKHVPSLLQSVALPALLDHTQKTFVAASWIVVACGAALRRKKEEDAKLSEKKNSKGVLVQENPYSPELLSDARKVFASIFPWSMAHNHTLRVFAQAAVREMLEQFGPKTFSVAFGTTEGTEKNKKMRISPVENPDSPFSEDALRTTYRLITTNEEMRKTRDACGDLFTQNLNPSPKALLAGLLDIEPKIETGEEHEFGETDNAALSAEPVAFEGAPVSAIDRVDFFLQRARAEIRVERETHENTLWRDAMR